MDFSFAQIATESKQTIHAKAKLFVSILALAKAKKGPVVIVANNSESMRAHLKNLRFLLSKHPDLTLRAFPVNDKTIYHASPRDPLLVQERAATAFMVASGQHPSILILPAEALAEKIPSVAFFQKYATIVQKGSVINRAEVLSALHHMGYIKVPQVLDRGTFAVRGSIIDIFVNTLKDPIRLDLFGDEIESIRYVDPASQRSTKAIDEVLIGPTREIILDEEAKSLAKERLYDLADELDFPTRKLNEKINEINNGIYFFGIEKLAPAFNPKMSTILDLYRQSGVTPDVIVEDAASLNAALCLLESSLTELYQQALARNELVFAPSSYWVTPKEVEQSLSFLPTTNVLETDTNAPFEASSEDMADLRNAVLKESISLNDSDAPSLLKPVAAKIKSFHTDGHCVVLLASSKEKEVQLRSLLEPFGLNITPLKHDLDLMNDWQPHYQKHVHAFVTFNKHLPFSGALLRFLHVALITEDDIFGQKTRRKTSQSGKKQGFGTSVSDLNPNDFVVHVDHGIGQFKGIVRLTMHGVASDYVLIHYAKEEKLYLPIHRLNLIKPYGVVGEHAAVKLDKLGGTTWISKKKKANEAVMAMAQDLLKLYAKRQMVLRPPFHAPDGHYLEFSDNFPFETTPDQQKAIDDVVKDMQKNTPMDRLVCGDVGYGKTEVAMRAAMLAVLSKKQVAVLAPTTVLAQQHGINFSERFGNTGVNIEVISRFQKDSEVKKTIERLKRHDTDIVIGTHRLLSPDVEFKDLGLMVVDEEQRFGIKAKEHLKKMRTKVDVLTMSATPIPRTLQMSYFGIRDLSIIETPPVDRRAIQTYVAQFDDALIKEAILRELSRGGQVYFVHNRVSSIEATADYLRNLVPEARIGVAHGQMPEAVLEEKMLKFMNHHINVLVCTTIIETGIDVSNANTMFIDHADDFGLSQLYQLRGRIGRSKERAFAYLLIKGGMESLTPIAKTRLDILHKFSELGAGFKIAQHDLELRGAGDLLGREQHGHMAAIGYDLYAELLKEAVNGLQGKEHEDAIDAEVILPISALIPESYCEDLHERLSYYQRLVSAHSDEEIETLLTEMADSLGDIPDEVRALAKSLSLKIYLAPLKALKMEIQKGPDEKSLSVSVLLSPRSLLDPDKLMASLQKNAFKITPQQKIIQIVGVSEPDRIDALYAAGIKAIETIRGITADEPKKVN